MPIPVDSLHTATLTVPVSGVPADQITVVEDKISHTMTFTAKSAVSPADARQKLKDFLSAAKDASLAP